MSEPEHRPDPEPTAWADPLPTYQSVAPSYAATFNDELAQKPFDRVLLDRFAASLGSSPSSDSPVCDLGCGPGHIGRYLADLGLPVVGIDLSPAMLEQARRLQPDIVFSTGDMTALDQSDGAFSAIVCFYAVIHLPRAHVPTALAEMHRTLQPGGSLLLSAHGGVGTLHATEMLEHPVSLDATLFSLDELSQLAAAAGFTVVESHEREPYPEELATQRLYLWATRGR